MNKLILATAVMFVLGVYAHAETWKTPRSNGGDQQLHTAEYGGSQYSTLSFDGTLTVITTKETVFQGIHASSSAATVEYRIYDSSTTTPLGSLVGIYYGATTGVDKELKFPTRLKQGLTVQASDGTVELINIKYWSQND